MEVEFACISFSILNMYSLRLKVFKCFAKGHKVVSDISGIEFWA